MTKRLIRISKILKSVQETSKSGLACSLKKLVALMCLETGITRRTALEYIKILIDGEKIIKDGDELWAADNAEQKLFKRGEEREETRERSKGQGADSFEECGLTLPD